MRRLAIFSFLVLSFFFSSNLLSALNYEEAKIAAQEINKPALLTILSPDGDLIDCVDETKQPAFDHPLLKNHKLQKKVPEIWEENQRDDEYSKKKRRYVNKVTQVWQKNGTRCPTGSVPVRRVKVEELMRANSISEFGKKPKPLGRNLVRTTTSPKNEKVIAVFNKSMVVHGASATINVWNLTVENAHEFSLSQIWIFSGEEDDFNTVEAGWRVKYGSTTPRLFTYWTGDGYRTTGCYNTLCRSGVGFVQNNPGVAVGVALAASTRGGEQKEINLKISKDASGDWRLYYNYEEVGYWPKELFNAFSDERSTIVEWGGEVRNLGNPIHTRTKMGSGRFAEKGVQQASYFSDLYVQHPIHGFTRVMDGDVGVNIDKEECYSMMGNVDENGAMAFYYGGPGRNRDCLR